MGSVHWEVIKIWLLLTIYPQLKWNIFQQTISAVTGQCRLPELHVMEYPADHYYYFSPFMTKTTKWHVPPAKTQISLGIRPDWSESSLSARWKLGSLATHWMQAKPLIRLGGYLGWSESSLGVKAILLVLWWGGSFEVVCRAPGTVLIMFLKSFLFVVILTNHLLCVFTTLLRVSWVHTSKLVHDSRENCTFPSIV